MQVLRSQKFLPLLWLFFLCPATFAHAQDTQKELVARGQYIFAVSGGCACHSERKGVYHAGARPFQIPIGTVYSTNITSDPETGLGNWTDQQIIDALIKGLRKDGSRLLPLMPYTLYSGMAQEDLKALVAYLRSLKPVKKATPELKTSAPFVRSVVTGIWL
ncbi:MAG TPA: cytochrome c, partial [Candidatus Binatia bacterium]|nr:cytochrome c [Candidatus Binatia bacterium]